MAIIDLSTSQKEAITSKIQTYLANELDVELGQFDAEFLLDFFAENIGVFFYNKGLSDARVILQGKLDAIDEDLYAAEKETL